MFVNTSTRIELENHERQALRLLLDTIDWSEDQYETIRSILEAADRDKPINRQSENPFKDFLDRLIGGM